jgi:hypothetical protein
VSLFLVYHNDSTLVCASDRRVVARNEHGERVPAGNNAPKFTVLPNNLVAAALGRHDVAQRVLEGTERMVTNCATMSFDDVASVYPFALTSMFKHRPTPREYDAVAGVVCGWDAKLARMRTVSWHSDEEFAPWERYDEVQNLSAFGVVGVDTKSLMMRLARETEQASPAVCTPAFLAARLRETVRRIAQKNPALVSREAYFAAFYRDQRLSLPVEYEPPVVEPNVAALLGESRFLVGSIRTPQVGGPDTVGNNDGGTGSQIGSKNIFLMTAPSSGVFLTTNTGSAVNPMSAIDNQVDTFCAMQVSGSGSPSESTIYFSGAAAILSRN